MDRDLARAIEASLNVSQDDRDNEPSVIVIDSSDDEDDTICNKTANPSSKVLAEKPSENDQSIILVESSFEEDADHKLAMRLQAQFEQERAAIEIRKAAYKQFTESQPSTPSKEKENRPTQNFDDYELARKLQK